MNRPLTASEYQLARWMLEHGTPAASCFLSQLEMAEVTPWRCECGCGSLNFAIRGYDEPECGMNLLADFVIGDNDLAGIFIYECQGVLSGIEVYGMAGDAPKTLPKPHELRHFTPNRNTN